MSNILVVEDDTTEGSIIRDFLSKESHCVEHVQSGRHAFERVRTGQFDLMILDLGLPDICGLEILKVLRAEGLALPVLILTGRNRSDEIIAGLDSGADDYLTKPFNVLELGARVRAHLRRSTGAVTDVLKYGYVCLDIQNHRVTVSGGEISLLPKEFALLEYILRNPSRIFSAETLLKNVWKSSDDGGPEMVRTCMSRLRQRLEVEGMESIIETVYGVGYRLRRLAEGQE